VTDELRKQNERAIWDKIARSYDRNVMGTYEEAYRLTNEAILSEITPNSSVLEIGCGTGIVSLAIAPHAGEVIGVDLSPSMIAQAEKKTHQAAFQNLSFQEADAYALPFEDESFDMVLLTNLLHVVAEPETVIQEACRVLRKSGILAAVTDCLAERVPFRVWFNLLTLRAMKLFGTVKVMHFLHKSDLRDWFKSNGIRIHKEAVLHAAPVNFYIAGSKGEGSP